MIDYTTITWKEHLVLVKWTQARLYDLRHLSDQDQKKIDGALPFGISYQWLWSGSFQIQLAHVVEAAQNPPTRWQDASACECLLGFMLKNQIASWLVAIALLDAHQYLYHTCGVHHG